jgi:phosphatidate cytidylyltransferase
LSERILQQIKSRELLVRTLSALLLAPIFLGAYYLGGVALAVIVLLMAIGVCWEFYQLAKGVGYQPSVYPGYLASAAVVLAAFFRYELTWPVAVFLLLTTPLWVSRSQPTQISFANWAISIGGFLYAGGLLHHFILLRQMEAGLALGLMAILGTWAADSGAYLVGKNFGRHKFASHLSPKKTWEGAIGGTAAGFLAILALGLLFHIPTVHAAALGVLVPVVSILGDLTESLLKRSANVKDASHLIPGHGGLLDRIDSLMFAIVAAYYYAFSLM